MSPRPRTDSRYRARSAIAFALVAALTGCASGPSQEELVTTSDTTRRTVIEIAERAGQVVLDTYPDLGFERDPSPIDDDDRWSDCTDVISPGGPGYVPELVVWTARRAYLLPGAGDVFPLIDAVLAPFLTDGWQPGNDAKNDDQRTINAYHDGYQLAVDANVPSTPQGRASIDITVYSDCLAAPADLLTLYPQD